MKNFLFVVGWTFAAVNFVVIVWFVMRGARPRRNFGVRPTYKHPALGAPYAPSRIFVCCEHDAECERRGIPCEFHPDAVRKAAWNSWAEVYDAPFGYACPPERCTDPLRCKNAQKCADRAIQLYKTN